MRAVARKRERYTHDVKVGRHTITADEPEKQGGQDLGPEPAGAAGRVAGDPARP